VFGHNWKGRSYDLGRMNLRQLVIAYVTYPTIQLYILIAAACGVYVWLTPADPLRLALSAAAIVLIYPLAWYAIHRFILHGRYLYRWSMTARIWKRIHFDHHQDPHKLDVLFGSPLNTLPTMAAFTFPVGYALAGGPGAAAALATALIWTCFYEFCHCIEHLNFTPRWSYLKKMKKRHLLHHFHNENTNYGITNFYVDRLFGNFAESSRDVPRSATVYNLGYDLAEAERYPWVMEATGSPPRDRPPRAGEQVPAS